MVLRFALAQGIIDRHPTVLDFDTKVGSISLGSVRGSIRQIEPNKYGVSWKWNLATPTELTLRMIEPIGLVANLRSPERENEFTCKPR